MGDAILAECAQLDKIWGIGLRMTSPNRFNPKKWKGKNLLGKTLMAVRATLAENIGIGPNPGVGLFR